MAESENQNTTGKSQQLMHASRLTLSPICWTESQSSMQGGVELTTVGPGRLVGGWGEKRVNDRQNEMNLISHLPTHPGKISPELTVELTP